MSTVSTSAAKSPIVGANGIEAASGDDVDDHMITNYFTDATASAHYTEMLIRHLTSGRLLHVLMDASTELGINNLPVLFASDKMYDAHPNRFCGLCKVHLGVWDAFHGGMTEIAPVPVCSDECLQGYRQRSEATGDSVTETLCSESNSDDSDDSVVDYVEM